MAPFYKGYSRDFRLNSDDIEAIQTLYGMYFTWKATKTTIFVDTFKRRWIVDDKSSFRIFSFKRSVYLFKSR